MIDRSNKTKLSISTQANQVWALDTAYILMCKGFVHLTAIVDVATRRVMAHKLAQWRETVHGRARSMA